jgi:hypothetical protein
VEAGTDRVCLGQRLWVSGYGFTSGQSASMELGSKGRIGSGKVDSDGIVRITSDPIDESFCDLPIGDAVTVTVGERTQQVTVRFC